MTKIPVAAITVLEVPENCTVEIRKERLGRTAVFVRTSQILLKLSIV